MKRLLIISLFLAGFNSCASYQSSRGSFAQYRPSGPSTSGFLGGSSGRYLGSGYWDDSRSQLIVNMADWSEQKLENDFKNQAIYNSFSPYRASIGNLLPKLSILINNIPIIETVLMYLAGVTVADIAQINILKKKALISERLDLGSIPLLDFDLLTKLGEQMRSQIDKFDGEYRRVSSSYSLAEAVLSGLIEESSSLNVRLNTVSSELQLKQSEVRSKRVEIASLESAITGLTQQVASREGELTQELQDEIAQVRAEGPRDFYFDIQSARSLNHDRRRQLQEAEIVFRNSLKPHQHRLAEFKVKLAMSRPEDPERVALTKELNELLKLDPQSIDGKNNLAAVRKAIEKYDLNHSKYIFPMIDDEGLSKWRIALIQFGERYVPAVHKVADQVTEAVIIPAVSEADDFGGFLESKSVSPDELVDLAEGNLGIASSSLDSSLLRRDYEEPVAGQDETKGEPAILQDSKGDDTCATSSSMPVSVELAEWASNLGVSAMNGYLKANPNDLAIRLSVAEVNERLPKIRAIIQRADAHAAHNNGRTLLGLNQGDVERWRTYLNSNC